VSKNKIIKEFISVYKKEPVFSVRVPGRVNLIGEHIDYNGFPVLPISIPHSIIVAGSPRDDRTIHIRNCDPLFPAASFEVSDSIPHSRHGHWANYVKAAAQALSTVLTEPLNGADLFVEGSIPNSAGLSSSSALVIASALSILAAGKHSMDPIELAELMAKGEQYVGTQGGGMDQAICLLGKENYAEKIDFFPLQHQYVSFPNNYSIVVAHSLIRAAKTENALVHYNRRPAECRLATAIINAVLKPKKPITRLGDLRKTDGWDEKMNNPDNFVDSIFNRESYTMDDVTDLTGETAEQITLKYLLMRDGTPMPVPPEGFLIRQRALHVFTEANRVYKSCKALQDNETDTFGSLMNASHKSCDKNYGLSTPELNKLVSIMRDFGAVGARLTGAGFGGCAVGLAKDSDIRTIMQGVKDHYYN